MVYCSYTQLVNSEISVVFTFSLIRGKLQNDTLRLMWNSERCKEENVHNILAVDWNVWCFLLQLLRLAVRIACDTTKLLFTLWHENLQLLTHTLNLVARNLTNFSNFFIAICAINSSCHPGYLYEMIMLSTSSVAVLTTLCGIAVHTQPWLSYPTSSHERRCWHCNPNQKPNSLFHPVASEWLSLVAHN